MITVRAITTIYVEEKCQRLAENLGNTGNSQATHSGATESERRVDRAMSDLPVLKWEKNLTLNSPPLKNHTSTLVNGIIYVFGGYDGRRNYSNMQMFDTKALKWLTPSTPISGECPESRNGHTATVVDGYIYIIGGWLESCPCAGRDVHRLHVDSLSWVPTFQSPKAPVCNMHSADYISHLNVILVFRGGDGKDYLNDLHAYDIGDHLHSL
jgi:leucine-zipper-like transcriptional regulator 1